MLTDTEFRGRQFMSVSYKSSCTNAVLQESSIHGYKLKRSMNCPCLRHEDVNGGRSEVEFYTAIEASGQLHDCRYST